MIRLGDLRVTGNALTLGDPDLGAPWRLGNVPDGEFAVWAEPVLAEDGALHHALVAVVFQPDAFFEAFAGDYGEPLATVPCETQLQFSSASTVGFVPGFGAGSYAVWWWYGADVSTAPHEDIVAVGVMCMREADTLRGLQAPG